MSRPEGAPRLGFLGAGWIGRQRMEALAAAGAARLVAVADTDPSAAAGAAASVGAVAVAPESLLEMGLDGIVLATPSGLHAAQAVTALEHGLAVFCQKPLATTAEAAEEVVRAARRSGLLLGVDMSYRHLEASRAVRARLAAGAIGEVYAADLVFHNAYGPDKKWARDIALAGGGCVMDLGVHLVDLALWTLAPAKVEGVSARLFAAGAPYTRAAPLTDRKAGPEVEDYAVARLDLATGAVVTIACSWHAHLGREAEISATFRGDRGSLELRNVQGSFYDFTAAQDTGARHHILVGPPDEWGGRALVSWARRLEAGEGFDVQAADEVVEVARVLDLVYGCSCW